MREIDRVELPASGARALAWVLGELYDVAAGWTHYPLDRSPSRRRYSGYEAERGTEGLLAGVVNAVAAEGTALVTGGSWIRPT